MKPKLFYWWPPEKQRAWTIKSLIKYIQDYVYPYHPFYRKKYKEMGIDPHRLKTYDDILKLPITTKEDYRKDTKAFILQPSFPGQEPQKGPDGKPYETERISKKLMFKYIYQAFTEPEVASLYHKQTFKDKIIMKITREWFPVHFHSSAGTTGDPTPAAYTYYELKKIIPDLIGSNIYFRGKDYWNTRGRDPRYNWKTLSLYPAAPHLAFFSSVCATFLEGQSVFQTCGGNVVPTERSIKLCEEGQFEVVVGIPSYVIYWLRKALEMKKAGELQSLTNLRIISLGGEPVTPGLKELIFNLVRELGAHPDFEVRDQYGMTETKWGFGECETDQNIHLNPKYFFWEMLHPDTLEPVKEGEPGILTFSHINWRGTVFIRYLTGDLFENGIRWERCPGCGLTSVKLYPPSARAKRDFTKIKGTRVPLHHLVSVVRDTPGVYNFQVILTKEDESDPYSRDKLVIRVLPEEGIEREGLIGDLKKRVKSATEVTPDEIVFEEDREGFEAELFAKTGIKAEYLVDKRPIHI